MHMIRLLPWMRGSYGLLSRLTCVEHFFLSYRNYTKSYPLVNSDMEFSYHKNKERYTSLQEWATDKNLGDIQWRHKEKETKWRQFLRDTFHIHPNIQTLNNSEEVQIWDIANLSFTECTHKQKTDCLMMQDMMTIVKLLHKRLMPSDSSQSELLQALRPKMTVVGL